VALRHNLHDKGSPLKYDFAPDGSMMIWRNAMQKNRRIDIESIEFQYRLLGVEKAAAKPAAQAKSRGPTGCKLVGTVRGTKLWAGDCMDAGAPVPAESAPASPPPGQKQ
jgi:hypothetical protein